MGANTSIRYVSKLGERKRHEKVEQKDEKRDEDVQ